MFVDRCQSYHVRRPSRSQSIPKAHMIVLRVALSLAGAFLVISLHGVAAQCTPELQHRINQRQFEPVQSQLTAQLARTSRDDAAMNCMGRLFLDKGDAETAVSWFEK